jgi:dienelactone hydrolase
MFTVILLNASRSLGQNSFPFTAEPLTDSVDLSAKMVEAVDRFFVIETKRLAGSRGDIWKYDFLSVDGFNSSIDKHRILLANRLGVVEKRLEPSLFVLNDDQLQPVLLKTADISVMAVRWETLDGMPADGILLKPKGRILARVVMLPDADILPEVLAGLKEKDAAGFGAAQQLANAGCEVLIPLLINRDCTYSGSASLNRFTNQPHREWIYRQAYELGRHVIGYELQKIFAAIDWFQFQNKKEHSKAPIGVAGYGEGGLLALYASALDTRIEASLVSGYFDNRSELWHEPIYRNVFGLLKYFGDAELAVMSWPRPLTIEHTKGPEITGPPPASKGRAGAAPGILTTPDLLRAQTEWKKANNSLPDGKSHLRWVYEPTSKNPFSASALRQFTKDLKIPFAKTKSVNLISVAENKWVSVNKRQEKAVKEMEQVVQNLLDTCSRVRDRDYWSTLKGDSTMQKTVKRKQRERLGDVIGMLPRPTIPVNPKARLLKVTDKWTSYEVTLDVLTPGVFAWGILIVPNGISAGQRLPAVVCQHGLEGIPADVVTNDTTTIGWKFYKSFATKLADRGYVTFVPHNPYRGEDKFRVLQRKGNPIGLSLFSVITSQHTRIVEWLAKQTFIDPARIGFYGLSYGGTTAMRIPALVEGYALSICSANFNEWIVKVSTTRYAFSYMFSKEYDMVEWNMGTTFNYAEMAALIAPRPFMVERGFNDNVGGDEWVDFEFAKVRRHYVRLGIPGAVRIEHFVGPHTINGVGTFDFLDQHLKALQ